jgi:hypothetical protein
MSATAEPDGIAIVRRAPKQGTWRGAEWQPAEGVCGTARSLTTLHVQIGEEP